MLYDSLNRKIKALPDNVIVYPAQDPDRLAEKNIGKETFSTIEEQKKFNYALKDQSKDEFVKELTTGILPPPQYFFEDARDQQKKDTRPVDTVIDPQQQATSNREKLRSCSTMGR